MTKPLKAETHDDGIVGPAKVTDRHEQDRPTGAAAGSAHGWRFYDGLQWLVRHKSIDQGQCDAGRTLQGDWQSAQKVRCPGMSFGVSGGGGDIIVSKMEATQRFDRARNVIPPELWPITALFLLPGYYPGQDPDPDAGEARTLEWCAKQIGIHVKAASFGMRVALSQLARHYSKTRFDRDE